MKKLYVLMPFIICLNFLISAQVDPVPADTTIGEMLKQIPLPNQLDLIVVYIKRLPFAETYVGQLELEKNYTGQEMPAIVARTPSVTWYSDGGGFTGYSYMRMRGLDQTRINVTLNGVPLNEPEDQGAYFSNYPDFLNSVRSIQVYRGVGTTAHGTTAFAGSINLTTLQPDTAYSEVSLSAGSFRTHRFSAEFNTGMLRNRWSFYGRFSNAASDGFREHSGTDGQSFFFNAGYTGKAGNFKLTGFTGLSKNEMAYLAEPDSLLKVNYRANSLTRNEKDEFRQTMVSLNYDISFGRSVISAAAYYNYLQGGYDILFPPDLYNFSVKSNFAGSFVNYTYQRYQFKLVAGIHANDYMRYHYSFIQPDETNLLYRNNGHKNEVSSFVKASYDFRKFNFFADLQYRYVTFKYNTDAASPLNIPSVDWQFVNPKAGISYLLRRGNIIYASVGKTSREPTRNDLFAGYDNLDSLTYAEIGSLERVKPESVIDFEIGIKLERNKLRLDLNLYDMEFKNEIAAIGQLSYIGLPLRKNVASSYRRGIELGLNYKPVPRLNLNTQANFSINQIKEYTTDYDSITYRNVQPLLTPQAIINQTVDYAFNNWLSAGVSGRYVSRSFLDNTGNEQFIVPESFLLDASLSVRFLKNHSVNFMVNNILGQKYYSSGYVQGGQSYYFAMATRNYFVTLKLRF